MRFNKREKERERERDRQTDRQTDRQREGEIENQYYMVQPSALCQPKTKRNKTDSPEKNFLYLRK